MRSCSSCGEEARPTQGVVSSVVYLYLAACVALLVFNVVYIARAQQVAHRRARRVQRWLRRLETRGPKTALTRRTMRRLKRIEQLMALDGALELADSATRQETARVLFIDNHDALDAVALAYGKREPMERAFFAYMVATYYPAEADPRNSLVVILLGYLDSSTVYCRENVLNALYRLGNPQAIEHAFDLLNEQGWYHQPHLLSDGLLTCTCNRDELAERLWKKRHVWEECLVVAAVQFAAALPDPTLAPSFAEALTREDLPLEVRFALVRYLRRHPVPSARDELIRLVEGGRPEESDLAVAAASALASYPGPDTKAALLNSLHSRSWYVRRNAADSLRVLGVTAEEARAVAQTGDRYATEMLSYTLSHQGGRP